MGSSPFDKISLKKTLIKIELHLFNFLFGGIWAHYSWSCFPICITFVYGIAITSFGETN
jgi:hypothetical protein